MRSIDFLNYLNNFQKNNEKETIFNIFRYTFLQGFAPSIARIRLTKLSTSYSN